MKAITLWPEWLWVIKNLDKRIENRTWKLPNSLLWKPVGLHAGMSIGGSGKVRDGFLYVYQAARHFGFDCDFRPEGISFGNGKVLSRSSIDYGKIVAVAIFSACDTRTGKWAFGGQYHWHMSDVKFLKNPVACRGKQGLWDVPSDVLVKIAAQIKESDNDITAD